MLPAALRACARVGGAMTLIAPSCVMHTLPAAAESQRMLVESESQYMALRGGMSDHDRDVSAGVEQSMPAPASMLACAAAAGMHVLSVHLKQTWVP